LVKKIAPVPFSVSSMDSFHVIHLALSFAWLTASVAPVKAEQPPGADCQSPQPGQIVFDKEVGPGARLVVTSVQTKAAGPMTAVPPGNDAKFRFTYVLARSGASLAVRTVDETQVIPGEVSDVVYKVLDAKLEGNILFILFWQTRRTALVVVNVDKPPPNNGEMLDFLMSDDDVRRQVRRGTISGSARDGTLKVRIERSRQSGPDEVVNYALRWRWGLPDLVRTDSPVSRRAK
jgi:hypothetical protein